MLVYCANYQPTKQAKFFEATSRSIGTCVEKLIKEKNFKRKIYADWIYITSYYFVIDNLGRFLLSIGDVEEAYTAFQEAMSHDSEDDTPQHKTVECDNCNISGESIEGHRFVCYNCPNTDLCEPCMNMHLENPCLPACKGHDFLKIPPDGWERLPDGKVNALGESLDEWLTRIQEKYRVSAPTETPLASESGPEKNESERHTIDPDS